MSKKFAVSRRSAVKVLKYMIAKLDESSNLSARESMRDVFDPWAGVRVGHEDECHCESCRYGR